MTTGWRRECAMFTFLHYDILHVTRSLVPIQARCKMFSRLLGILSEGVPSPLSRRRKAAATQPKQDGFVCYEKFRILCA